MDTFIRQASDRNKTDRQTDMPKLAVMAIGTKRKEKHHFKWKIKHFSDEGTEKRYHSEYTKTRHFN